MQSVKKKPWRLNKSWWLADDTDWHPISCHFWSCSTFNEDTIHPTTMSDDFKKLISQHEVCIKDDDDAIDNVHAVTVPDAVAAGIPTHADDMAIPTPGACRPNTRIAAGNIISVDSTTSLPTPSSPPVRATLPRVVAPTTVSAPVQADIQALVATLTQHVTELLLQQAVSSDQVAPILAEKKRIEADADVLEQRQHAVAQSLARLDLEHQRVNEALENAEQALYTFTQIANMWQGAAEIALGLQ
jgi:hypothetical protein